MIHHISSLDDNRLNVYTRLTDVELRRTFEPEHGIFIAESPRVIERTLQGGAKPLSLLIEEKWLERMKTLIAAYEKNDTNVPMFVASKNLLESLIGYNMTRGALAAFERPKLPSVQKLIQNAKCIAVLEDITNFTNVGVIFRNAAALGIDAIIISPCCYDPLYRRSVRVSMGSVMLIPWTRYLENNNSDENNSIRFIETLHNNGFTTVALALSEHAISLQSKELKQAKKLALFLGTEGDGLQNKTIANCMYVARIPMYKGVDSLNVAAASAVAFWELHKHT